MKTGKETKKEMIAQLQIDRKELEDALNSLSADQMKIEGAQGTWSVKDIVAHITTWEHHGIDWIRSLAKGVKPMMPVPEMSMDEVRKNMVVLNIIRKTKAQLSNLFWMNLVKPSRR